MLRWQPGQDPEPDANRHDLWLPRPRMPAKARGHPVLILAASMTERHEASLLSTHDHDDRA